MRRWRRALVGAFLLAALAPAPASAAAPVVFEGRVAEATWTHCDDTGCIETTAYLSVGTATFPDKSVTDVNSLCVQATPSPQPSVATVITGCIPGVGTVAADLSGRASRSCTRRIATWRASAIRAAPSPSATRPSP